MNLQEIIKEQSDFVERSNVSLIINRAIPTILIDCAGEQIFMQEHECDAFFTECASLAQKLPYTDLHIIEQAVAYQYLDCLGC